MSDVIEIVRPSGGDWILVLVNGKIIEQGHSIDTRRLIEALVATFNINAGIICRELPDEEFEKQYN